MPIFSFIENTLIELFGNCQFAANINKRVRLHTSNVHRVKSVRIGVFLVEDFPAFRLNTERHCVSLRIQSKCGKK